MLMTIISYTKYIETSNNYTVEKEMKSNRLITNALFQLLFIVCVQPVILIKASKALELLDIES